MCVSVCVFEKGLEGEVYVDLVKILRILIPWYSYSVSVCMSTISFHDF